MTSQLDCGCWFICRCAEKEAVEKAKVLLKMADLNSVFYVQNDGAIIVYIQPYEAWSRDYGGIWNMRSLSNRRYKSIVGLQKGIGEIIKKKIEDPSYLLLPEPDPRSQRFGVPSKRKRGDNDLCRRIDVS